MKDIKPRKRNKTALKRVKLRNNRNANNYEHLSKLSSFIRVGHAIFSLHLGMVTRFVPNGSPGSCVFESLRFFPAHPPPFSLHPPLVRFDKSLTRQNLTSLWFFQKLPQVSEHHLHCDIPNFFSGHLLGLLKNVFKLQTVLVQSIVSIQLNVTVSHSDWTGGLCSPSLN